MFSHAMSLINVPCICKHVILSDFKYVDKLCLTLCNPMDCSTPGVPVSDYLLDFAQVHFHCIGDALQPFLLFPSIFPMSWHFTSEYWPKYWNFSFNISPSSEYSELISFRIDKFDLLTVQGTLKTLLQHNSSKASIL